nr:EamA family transporter [Agromyces seonyuensis]
MNLTFYISVARLGLGVAATIEFLGPLALALLTSRRLLDVICAVAAGAGVFLLTGLDGTADVLGILLALTAAGAWAAYIVLTRTVAHGLPGLEGVTIASIVSLVLLLPFAIAGFDAGAFDWGIVGLLLLIGVLSSAVPYSLDTYILRRIDTRLYAIITSFGPVIAAFFGVLVLGEHLAWLEWIAIVVVCAAAGTAIATQRDVPVVESSAAEAAAADAIVHEYGLEAGADEGVPDERVPDAPAEADAAGEPGAEPDAGGGPGSRPDSADGPR